MINMYVDSILITLYVVAPPILFTFIPFLLIIAAIKYSKLNKKYSSHFEMITLCLATVFPLAMIGMASGFLTGVSRSPAVTALIPALLTFIGVFGVYILGQKREYTSAVSLSIVAFALFIILGAIFGANYRELSERSIALQRAEDEVWLESVKYRMRQSLGLTDRLD